MTSKKFEYKLVIVIDNKLKMPKGKLAVQVGHAVSSIIVAEFFKFGIIKLYKWFKTGQKKVVVKSDNFLEDMSSISKDFGSVCLVKDAGHTVFNEPTYTCFTVGLIKNNNKYFDRFKLV